MLLVTAANAAAAAPAEHPQSEYNSLSRLSKAGFKEGTKLGSTMIRPPKALECGNPCFEGG
jgi:hypothetical protein